MATKIKENNVEDRVNAIEIDDPVKGVTYTLDFSREAVVMAMSQGFDIDEVPKFYTLMAKDLFYMAFRMHHGPKRGNISKATTDELFDRMGGLSPDFVKQLILLYKQAAYSNDAVETTEEMEKNGGVTVRM